MSFYQNGILISGVNTLPELTRAQYEALPADKRPEYWVCLDEEYEPASSGHEIENSAGTKLTQRDVMQVLDGLEAVDDSTNQKTKIKMNLPIVSSADWNAMTEQEKTAYKASHYRFGVEVPDTEGVINAEYMKLLWENPNTTQAFPAQTITLNSADYDFLFLSCILYGQDNTSVSIIGEKGHGLYIEAEWYTQGDVHMRQRAFAYVSTTQFAVSDGLVDGVADNLSLIPIAIYGIKKNFQFKVNAIATDLSTSADHCMLSDNVTSVEDKFDELENNSFGSTIELTDSANYVCPSDGYFHIQCQNVQGSYAYGYVNDLVLLCATSPSSTYSTAFPNTSCFVRKGMTIKVVGGNGGTGKFHPIQ